MKRKQGECGGGENRPQFKFSPHPNCKFLVRNQVWNFNLFFFFSPPPIRLLRNRVSAQQARERKKAYLSELEVRVKDLESRNSELEERLSTLQNENQMLRHVCISHLHHHFHMITSPSQSYSIIIHIP